MKIQPFNDSNTFKRIGFIACAFLTLILFAPSCSGGDDKSGDQGASADVSQQKTCSFGETAYGPGESLTNSSDSCETCESTECFCQATGEWKGTGGACDACDATVIEECTETCEHGYQQDDNGCDICACNDAPETCTEGSTQDAGDGCNTCTCTAGSWECTTESCGECTPGETKTASDECSECTCTDESTWSCDSSACPAECEPGEDKTSEDGCTQCACGENGMWNCVETPCGSCSPGAVKDPPDDCCTCNEAGEWACSETPCPQTCEEGDVKDKGDGCNTCTCDGNNQWNCSEDTCGEGADCPPPADDDCELHICWGKNLVTGTCCEYDRFCAIPEELEKYGELEDCLNGPWDGWAGDAEASQAVDEGVPPDADPAPAGDAGTE